MNVFLQYSPWQKSCRLGTNWPEVPLKYISNQYFLQEMAHFNLNSFWNNVLVQNETVEKYSNVHSLVKPIESIFAKTKKSLVTLSYDAPNPILELHLWQIIDQSILGCV